MIELSDIYIKEPNWLFLIPVGTVLLFYFRSTLNSATDWLKTLSRHQYRHPGIELLQSSQHDQTIKNRKNLLRPFHYILLLCLFSLSLSQPYLIGKQLPEPPEHRDIVFLVDTSISMVLKDYIVDGKRTERMTVLKNVLGHFIDRLKGNRIKIIAFSEQAYTFVPFTTDYALLNFQIQRLDPASLTGRSSDLSHGLLYALQSYKQANLSQNTKPVFVMLTDAHRPVRKIDPRVAAELIAEHDIRVHTIAIGASSYQAEDKEDVTLVYHPTSFLLLEEIAKLGKGQFFWAKDANSLSQALISINNAEKRKVQTQPEFITKPLYYWPLLIAMIWLFLLYTIRFLSQFSQVKFAREDKL